MTLSMTTKLREFEKSNAQLRSELEDTKLQLEKHKDAAKLFEQKYEEAKQRIITLTSN